MRPAEPVTAVTDYLLAIVYLFFALRLFRKDRMERQHSTQSAAAAFFATMLAAAAGGTYHWIGGAILWKLTVYSMGLTSFFITVSAVFVALAGAARRAFLITGGLQFAAYAVWAWGHDDFRYVIYDYVAAMLMTFCLVAWAFYRRLSRSAVWIAAAILVTFAASGIQASGLDLHRHFNHNDLYHVIQMGAAWLFYRGFRKCKDRSETSQFDKAELR
jgi:hypothetical protein